MVAKTGRKVIKPNSKNVDTHKSLCFISHTNEWFHKILFQLEELESTMVCVERWMFILFSTHRREAAKRNYSIRKCQGKWKQSNSSVAMTYYSLIFKAELILIVCIIILGPIYPRYGWQNILLWDPKWNQYSHKRMQNRFSWNSCSGQT